MFSSVGPTSSRAVRVVCLRTRLSVFWPYQKKLARDQEEDDHAEGEATFPLQFRLAEQVLEAGIRHGAVSFGGAGRWGGEGERE